jgi:hypothetical protein
VSTKPPRWVAGRYRIGANDIDAIGRIVQHMATRRHHVVALTKLDADAPHKWEAVGICKRTRALCRFRVNTEGAAVLSTIIT